MNEFTKAEVSQYKILLCELHGKRCAFVQSYKKCPCCNKKICLCNYVL